MEETITAWNVLIAITRRWWLNWEVDIKEKAVLSLFWQNGFYLYASFSWLYDYQNMSELFPYGLNRTAVGTWQCQEWSFECTYGETHHYGPWLNGYRPVGKTLNGVGCTPLHCFWCRCRWTSLRLTRSVGEWWDNRDWCHKWWEEYSHCHI